MGNIELVSIDAHCAQKPGAEPDVVSACVKPHIGANWLALVAGGDREDGRHAKPQTVMGLVHVTGSVEPFTRLIRRPDVSDDSG